MKTHKEFLEEIEESQKLENRTKDALNVSSDVKNVMDIQDDIQGLPRRTEASE